MENQVVNAANKLEWFSESDNDRILGIVTKQYDNGNVVKRCTLSNGRVAQVRELMGEDMIEADKLANGQQELSLPAMMSKATQVEGKPLLLEDLKLLKAKDYNKIKAMTVALNF